ncbi:MAG: uncharacterized protein JWP52_819 [Rhizobacter sp.]|nr:uncharacterized protein [Rhizobacter sp.]
MNVADPSLRLERAAPLDLPASHHASPPNDDAPIAVDIDRLSFHADTARGRLPVLDSVSLQVKRGEFVSIVGPSGCGKSTILNFIAGLAASRGDGSIRLEGRLVSGVQPRIGYMFQSHGLLPWRSVAANVELGLELAGVSRTERRERAHELLAQLGLKGFEDHLPAELSGGMRQRVALARTLAIDPDVLLMDEPFGALDAHTKLLVQQTFLAHWEKHRKTVVFVTHDLAEAIALSDRIVVLTARPARVMAVYDVKLPRPRDPVALRGHPHAVRLWDQLWTDLRQELDRPEAASRP